MKQAMTGRATIAMGLVLALTLQLGCGGGDPATPGADGGGNSSSDTSKGSSGKEDASTRCVAEVERLAACGQITPQDAQFTVGECQSATYTDAQKAYVAACIAAWACGAATLPPCLSGSGGKPPTKGCTFDEDCPGAATCDLVSQTCKAPPAPETATQGDPCATDGYDGCKGATFYCFQSIGSEGRCVQSCATGVCPGKLKCCKNVVRELFYCDVSC